MLNIIIIMDTGKIDIRFMVKKHSEIIGRLLVVALSNWIEDTRGLKKIFIIKRKNEMNRNILSKFLRVLSNVALFI